MTPTINTHYAALLRRWAYLHTRRRNAVEQDEYKRLCAYLERMELARDEDETK